MCRFIYYDKAKKITTGHTVPTSNLEKGLIMGKPILFTVLCLFLCCVACSDSDSNAGNSDAGEDPVTYDIEVDCQENITPFGSYSGEGNVCDVFPDKARPIFTNSDLELTNEKLYAVFDSLTVYANCNRDSILLNGNWTYEHDNYLCFINGFLNAEGQYSGLCGLSRSWSYRGKGWSFVASWTLDIDIMIEWCTCHELGHQLAKLSHLCEYDPFVGLTMSGDHSEDDCLMAEQNPTECTHKTVFPLSFCSYCAAKLSR